MRIPEEWLQDREEGFSWWPGLLAQRVWTDEGLFRNSTTYYRLHTEIDLFRGGRQREQLRTAMEEEMDESHLSALVYDKGSDTFKLHSSVYAESEIEHWICKVFHAAAMLQIAQAYDIVARISESMHPSLAASQHPTQGAREEEDAIVGNALTRFTYEGRLDSRWAGNDEWRDVEWALERQAQAWEKTDLKSCRASFYWSPEPEKAIDLLVSSQDPHSVLGSGLHFTLTVPLKLSAKHVGMMALELNDHERDSWLKTHMLGSWCNHEGLLAFRLFVPNSLYQEGVLRELSVTMASRAVWVNEFFYRKKGEADEARKAQLR
ncbi:MAG: hypothetical protein IH945_00540 [Armatimonadetes bacterium]|nr:hypothetical protein [Armatimonadota bacterium]